MPWIGSAIALAAVAAAVRRKGLFRGALDTGLNAVPFIGAAKNAIEFARGRDFIPDRLPGNRREHLRRGAPQA